MKTKLLMIAVAMAGAASAHAQKPTSCGRGVVQRLICTGHGCVRLSAADQCALAGISVPEEMATLPTSAEEQGRRELTRLIASLR